MSKETGPTVGELTRYKRPENVLLMPDDSGEFVLYETAKAELTRLRGEVDRLQRVLGIDKAMKEPNAWNQHRAVIADQAKIIEGLKTRAETAEDRVKELEAEVERLKGLQSIIIETKEMWENIATEHAETINTLRAQLADYEQKFKVGNELHMEVKAKLWKTEAKLAELQARVRPGVEEVEKAIEKVVLSGPPTRRFTAKEIHKAINDILPPVPKVLTVEELLDKISIAQRAWAEQDAYPTPHGFARSFNEHLALMLKEAMGGEE